MVNGAAEMGVRGSICASVFIVGAGAPGGVSKPWARAVESWELKVESKTTAASERRILFFIRLTMLEK